MSETPPSLYTLKSWKTGNAAGEPVIIIETHEAGTFTVLMPSRAAKEMGQALLDEAVRTDQQPRH